MNKTYEDKKREFPYIKFKISDDPKHPIPVMGFFISPDLCIDIFWENVIALLKINDTSPQDNLDVKRLKAKKIAFITDIHKRDVVAKFNPHKGGYSFFIGYEGKVLNAPQEAEFSYILTSDEVMYEMGRFEQFAGEWMDKKVKGK